MERKTIGSFLAALRKSNGMTQQEVAERLNVSNKTVSKWERDESYPEITLIPVLAELYQVTSDEILRGERISKSEDPIEKADVKVEKQKRRLIDISITRFKNISLVALALTVLGIIILYTVAYGFYRPVLGFGIFLVFILSSVVLELIQMNVIDSSLKNDDYFLEKDLLKPLHINRIKYSAIVFAINTAAVIIALPILLYRSSYYLNSVISMESYLSLAPALAILVCIIISIIYKTASYKIKLFDGCCTDDSFPKSRLRNMNILHIGFVTLMLYSILSSVMGVTVAYPWISIAGIMISTITFAISTRGKNRLILIVAGVRNLLMGFAGMVLSLWLFFTFSDTRASVNFGRPSVFFLLLVLGLVLLYDIIKKKLYN